MALAYLLSMFIRPLFMKIPFVTVFDEYLGIMGVLVIVVFAIEKSMTKPFYEDN